MAKGIHENTTKLIKEETDQISLFPIYIYRTDKAHALFDISPCLAPRNSLLLPTVSLQADSATVSD